MVTLVRDDKEKATIRWCGDNDGGQHAYFGFKFDSVIKRFGVDSWNEWIELMERKGMGK